MCVMGARRWCRITDEVTWGTYDGAALPAAITWLRMHDDNALTVRANPNTYDVRSYDALNQLILRGSANIGVGFTLTTLLYHPQVAKWLDWALNLNASAAPVMYGAKSKTIDFWDARGPFRLTGCRVSRMQWTCSAQAAQSPVRVVIEGIAQKIAPLAPTLAEPAITVFPAVNTHYKFQHSKGGLKLGAGVARTDYDAFQATWTNLLQAKFFEDTWISCLEWCGRDTSFTLGKSINDGTDWAAYQALTEQPNAVMKFTNGAASVELDWKTKSQISSYDPNFPIGDIATESLGVTGIFDPGVGSQFSYAILP